MTVEFLVIAVYSTGAVCFGVLGFTGRVFLVPEPVGSDCNVWLGSVCRPESPRVGFVEPRFQPEPDPHPTWRNPGLCSEEPGAGPEQSEEPELQPGPGPERAADWADWADW